MRLIYFIWFLLSSYGYKFSRAGTVLDLDNVDTFHFDHRVFQDQLYALETFTPKDAVKCTLVSDSLLSVWSPDDLDNTLKEVWAYTLTNVPQLVKLVYTGSGGELYYQKVHNKYVALNPTRFHAALSALKTGKFEGNTGFVLNLKNTTNQRQLFVKHDDVDDGVRTVEFTPATQAKMTLVADGSQVLDTAKEGDYYTKVTGFLKEGNMVLASVEGVTGGTVTAHYLSRGTSGWSKLLKPAFLSQKERLRPLDVLDTLTLDLANPDEDKYHVTKEFETGLAATTYSPNPGYELATVKVGTNQLWSSTDRRVVKVFTVKLAEEFKLVRVTTKNSEGQVDHENFKHYNNQWDSENDLEFARILKSCHAHAKNLKNNTGVEPTSTVLDVVTPDHTLVTVKQGLSRGVRTQTFIPKEGANFRAVFSGGFEVVKLQEGANLVAEVVYLNNGAPYIFETTFLDAESNINTGYTWLDNGEPAVVDHYFFQNFLKNNVAKVDLSSYLKLDFSNPQGDHLSFYESYVTGVKATVVHADEGYYFREVTVGDNLLWSTTQLPGHAAYKVVGFKKNVWNGTGYYTLLQVESFFEGAAHTDFYSRNNTTWEVVTQTKFYELIHALKNPRRRSSRDVTPPEVPATPEAPAAPEETPTAPEEAEAPVPEEAGEVPATPEAPAAPEETPTAPEEAKAPVPEEAGEVPATPEAPTAPEETLEEDAGEAAGTPEEVEETTLTEVPVEEVTSENVEGTNPNAVHVVTLDTQHVDEALVSVVSGSSQDGYYFKSYAPKGNTFFGDVVGPHGFRFTYGHKLFGTLVKFYYVFSELAGATVYTVSHTNHTGPLVFYYTYVNGEWSHSMKPDALVNLLKAELTYTQEQKKDLVELENATKKFKEKMDKLAKERAKEAKNVKTTKVVAPKMLGKKTQLFDEMVDFDQHKPPTVPAEEETPEELEARKHAYAGGEKVAVEAELVYFDVSKPTANGFVHTKNYTCMGLNTVDVTPMAGKFLHVVSLHGKRLWVSSGNKRCTNLQLFYDNAQVIGAVLRVTTRTNSGKLKTGEEFDYLFVKDAELKVVTVKDFQKLANNRFQRAALVGTVSA